MTELAALVDARPFSVLLVSERYLTAGPSRSLLLVARQQASMIAANSREGAKSIRATLFRCQFRDF